MCDSWLSQSLRIFHLGSKEMGVRWGLRKVWKISWVRSKGLERKIYIERKEPYTMACDFHTIIHTAESSSKLRKRL